MIKEDNQRVYKGKNKSNPVCNMLSCLSLKSSYLYLFFGVAG